MERLSHLPACLYASLFTVLLLGCPTQLDVNEFDKNELLPIGPDNIKTSQNILDGGQPAAIADSGQSNDQQNNNNIPGTPGRDGGFDAAANTADSGLHDIENNNNIRDSGNAENINLMDAGTAEEGLTDAGGANTDSWSTPVYLDGPQAPSSYLYERLAIGGLGTLEAVAIHPDGSYGLILERTEIVHVLDFATMQTTRFNVGNYTFNDVRFHPNGHTALLVGYKGGGNNTEGVLLRFDDHAWQHEEQTTTDLFTEVTSVPNATKIQSLRFPTNPNRPAIVLLTGGSSSNHIAYLRTYDINLDTFDYLGATSTGSTEVTDLAITNNEFGEEGVLIVGGHMGATFQYYTEIGGVSEWRNQPGTSNTGNISYVEAHPSGSYALPINWSSGKIYRFETGTMCTPSEALSYNLSNIRSIAFQPNGQRALIFGRTSGSLGSVYEYRHDRFECNSQTCDVSFVPINSFTSAPYQADSNTYLVDAAWRSDCVGGLLIANAPGLIITFQAEGNENCWDGLPQ